MHAHEELAGAAVAELRGVENIAAALEQKARHGVDDAGPVGARQFEDKAVIGRHDLGDSLLQCVVCSVSLVSTLGVSRRAAVTRRCQPVTGVVNSASIPWHAY